MFQKVVAIGLVAGIIFLVQIVVYGVFEKFGLTQIPGGSPASFLTVVLVSKIVTAIAFVLLYRIAPAELVGSWAVYALYWWVFYALGDIGQATGPDYSMSEAVAGMISGAIYFPLSAYLLHRMLD